MSRYQPKDLDEYEGCPEDGDIGLLPLGVGWLSRKFRFETGATDERFATRLTAFCAPHLTVCATPMPRPCPICNEKVMLGDGRLGSAEIRVIGAEEIYAAPDLILHHVTAHNYKPPQEFIDAVMQGPKAGSLEHKALVSAMR